MPHIIVEEPTWCPTCQKTHAAGTPFYLTPSTERLERCSRQHYAYHEQRAKAKADPRKPK